MERQSPGKIITFYSYKGGTGRSMALANVAWILAGNGKRVLAMDWDLEAPGLHRYFYPFLVDKDLTASDGIIDFVLDFAVEAMTPSQVDIEVPKDWYKPYANILRYAAALDWDFGSGGRLDFISAGRQGPSYSTHVNSFNWHDFYDRLGGGVFLEAAKEKMRETYDYILIDSRTGVSDTSGICTVQMPDILVVCFTLNNQSIEGAAAVAHSVYEQRHASGLQVFPAPMRIENAEQQKLDRRWEYAKHKFALFPANISQQEREQYWNDVAVPYVPYYAYEEILATFGDRHRRTNSLLPSVEKLTAYLVVGPVKQLGVEESTREKVLAQFEGNPINLPRFEVEATLGLDAIGRKGLTIGRNITTHLTGGNLPSYEQRNRRAMIERVWAIWITGVLQPSLPQDILLELGLTERPAMVTRALDLLVQPDLADQVLAPGTPLVDVFDRLDRALLILGAPGSGKTTLLLTLARDLLQRVAQDPGQPIPVVFPLSSWAAQRRRLRDWLIDELQQRYDVPRTIGQAWVDADQVLPLLDGLDEVQSEHRVACAEAINTFRQDHGLLPLAVCSRITEYDALGVQLRLQGAIVVQPLTRPQVDSYLAQVGQPLAAVRQAFQEDPTLWELLDTPLMLTIVTLAYAGQQAETLSMQGTLGERRQSLLTAYVNRMFQRRSAVADYTRQQTERWLAWLAWQLAQHNQTVFYLERMQPDWLPQGQRWILRTGVSGSVGLIIGVMGALSSRFLEGPMSGLIGGMLAGLLAGVTAYSKDITSVETVRWSWSTVQSKLYQILRNGLLGGLSVGLLAGLIGGLKDGLLGGLSVGLLGGLSVGLLAGLIGGLKDGLIVGQIPTKTIPNEGIRRSARIALIAGLVGGLIAGTATWLMVWLMGGPINPLIGGLGAWLVIGPAAGLYYGGRACIQHFVLRLLLVCHGFAPWYYVDFLDYAAERLFLHRVSGGYIFVHRLLQDYFAVYYIESRGTGRRDMSLTKSTPNTTVVNK